MKLFERGAVRDELKVGKGLKCAHYDKKKKKKSQLHLQCISFIMVLISYLQTQGGK